MIEGPYFQAHLDGVSEDLGFSSLQGAMNYMEEHANPSGEIYYIPDDSRPVAFLVFTYDKGVIEAGPGIASEGLEEV